MRALFITPNSSIYNNVAIALRSEGYDVSLKMTGQIGLAAAKSEHWDILMVDLNLSDTDGVEFIQTLRTEFPSIPIIAFSHKNDVEEKIHALQKGADLAFSAQVAKSELLAYLEAFFRHNPPLQKVHVGSLVFNMKTHTLSQGKQEIALAGHNAEVALLLFSHVGQLVTDMQLIEELSGQGAPKTKKSYIRVCIYNIREMIRGLTRKEDGEYLRTVYGQGYMLVNPNAQSSDN